MSRRGRVATAAQSAIIQAVLPRAWARERGIELLAAEDLPPPRDFRSDLGVDFGRLVRRTPAFVLRPTTTQQLSECMRALAAAGTPYKLRGAAHSSAGEVLTDGGAVLDMTALRGVLDDDPAGEEITVRGGTTWLALCDHLASQERRPLTLTSNLHVTVAGTLSVGGVGDAAHLHGAQVAGVRRLVLVTPGGERHAVAPGQPLFDHALCGHGQVGAIAEVTIATWRRPHTLVGRMLRWDTLAAFLADAERVAERRLYDYFRPRLTWTTPGLRVWAIAAHMTEPTTLDDPQILHLTPLSAGPTEAVDLLAISRRAPIERWTYYSPCAELVFPYPDGLAALRRVDQAVGRGALAGYLPLGSALMLMPGTRGLPLSPFQPERCAILALRPEPKNVAGAELCQRLLAELTDEALAAGARVYLSSFPLGEASLARQLGDAAPALAALRAAVDPAGLCNRGNLHGWQSGAAS